VKKKSLLFVLLLLITFYSHAQSFITLSFGKSIPVGEFASKNNTTTAGGAKPGKNFELSFGRLIYKNKLGFISSVKVQLNDFDITSAQIIGKPTKDSRYQSFMILLGPYVEFKLHKNLALDVKIQGGYVRSSYPDIEAYSNVWWYTANTTRSSNSASSSFSGLVGVGIKRNIIKKLTLGLSIDYLKFTQKFNVTQKVYDPNVPSPPLLRRREVFTQRTGNKQLLSP
jgi:hypothetical protein